MRRFPTVNVNGSTPWELEGQPDVPPPPAYVDGRWRTALLGCYAFLTLLALGAVGNASSDLAEDDTDDQSVSTVGFLAGTIVVLHGVFISLPVFRGYPLLGADGALLDSSRMVSPTTIAALVSHVLMTAGVVLWILYVAQVGGPGIALGLALVLLAAMGLMVFVHWRGRRLAPPAGVSGRSVGLGIATLLLFPVVYLVGLVVLYATRNKRKTEEPVEPETEETERKQQKAEQQKDKQQEVKKLEQQKAKAEQQEAERKQQEAERKQQEADRKAKEEAEKLEQEALTLECTSSRFNIKDTTNGPPLWRAADQGNLACVKLLLKHPKINDVNVVHKSHTPLFRAVENGHDKVVEALIEATGIDINKRDTAELGYSPLQLASATGTAETVRLLLAAKADVNKANPIQNKTPLWNAAYNGRANVVKMLLDAGATIQQTSGFQTPLTVAKFWKSKVGENTGLPRRPGVGMYSEVFELLMAKLQSLTNVIQPGDPIMVKEVKPRVPPGESIQWGFEPSCQWRLNLGDKDCSPFYIPENENIKMAIDGNEDTKFLASYTSRPRGMVGFDVTPSVGPTLVTGLSIQTANDVPGRDPKSVILFGSNTDVEPVPTERTHNDFGIKDLWVELFKKDLPQVLDRKKTSYYEVFNRFNINNEEYKHYRFMVHSIQGDENAMQIAQVGLLSENAYGIEPVEPVAQALTQSVNIASGKVTNASSGHTSQNAVDGDPKTRWTSGRPFKDLEWWQVDLGDNPQYSNVNAVEIDWERAYASKYEIQLSKDGTKFSTVATVELPSGHPAGPTKRTEFKSGNARYVRINGITRQNTSFGYSFYEVRVFTA